MNSNAERFLLDGTYAHDPHCHDKPSYPQNTIQSTSHKLNYLCCIVENRSGRVETEIMVRNNTRSSPLFSIKINLQHMVRHVFSKTQLLIGDLCLRVLCALNNDIGLLHISVTFKAQTAAEKARRKQPLSICHLFGLSHTEHQILGGGYKCHDV